MNLKAWMPLAVALVLGLLAAKLVRDRMNKPAPPPPPSNLVPVVVAKGPVGPAQELTEADLTVSRVPPETVPAQSFSDPSAVVGRVTAAQLVTGQTVMETLLAPKGTGAGPQALVPPGMRAITMEINEFSGVAGMLLPGCRVDIISVVRDDAAQESVARTIVQNLRVLAIGRSLSAQPAAPAGENQPAGVTNFNSITLLATPEEAQAIQLASSSGRPWLVLRGGLDNEEFDARATSTAELRGEPRGLEVVTKADDPFAESVVPPPPPLPTTQPLPVTEVKPKPRRTVTFIRGTKESAMELDVAEGAEGEGADPVAPRSDDPWVTSSDQGPATVQ